MINQCVIALFECLRKILAVLASETFAACKAWKIVMYEILGFEVSV